jgi:tight adherence protein B
VTLAGCACAGLAGLAVAVLVPAARSSRLGTLGAAGDRPSRGRAWTTAVAAVAGARLRRSVRTSQTAAAVVELAEVLSAELWAGRAPAAALGLACAAVDDPTLSAALGPVAETARLGGEVPDVLASASGEPGCRALGWLGVAWRVAEGSGAGLASTVERIAAAARADGEHRREVSAQLASPRATALLLAGLPVIGLGLGALLGADPLGFLFGTPAGWGCLVTGASLEFAGLAWTRRMSATAERG